MPLQRSQNPYPLKVILKGFAITKDIIQVGNAAFIPQAVQHFLHALQDGYQVRRSFFPLKLKVKLLVSDCIHYSTDYHYQ